MGLDPTVLARLVDAQTQLLATLLATIADLDQAITTRLATHPKAHLLARLPRRRPHQPRQAVRVLGRAWLRVIWTCWHTNTPYDPARHGADQRLAAA